MKSILRKHIFYVRNTKKFWFAKNGDKVDIQHSLEEKTGVFVVDNWVTKSEETINGETVAKGTWLVTVEVTDDSIWDQRRSLTLVF